MNCLDSRQIILQRKNAKKLAHALGTVFILVTFSKRVHEEVREVPNERDKFRVNLEQADGANEG